MIQWIGAPVEDATWEFAKDIMARYPEFEIGDGSSAVEAWGQVVFQAERVVRDQNYFNCFL